MLLYEEKKHYPQLHSLTTIWQVQYTVCRDSDGNLLSADTIGTRDDYHQEIIPEEKVCDSNAVRFLFPDRHMPIHEVNNYGIQE